uniref:DRBM domain-containing protein n=1 Tax=Rhabditophanes sp. KR3021 TaxID=114890 RepID=A0AC35TVI2_9BILA
MSGEQDSDDLILHGESIVEDGQSELGEDDGLFDFGFTEAPLNTIEVNNADWEMDTCDKGWKDLVYTEPEATIENLFTLNTEVESSSCITFDEEDIDLVGPTCFLTEEQRRPLQWTLEDLQKPGCSYLQLLRFAEEPRTNFKILQRSTINVCPKRGKNFIKNHTVNLYFAGKEVTVTHVNKSVAVQMAARHIITELVKAGDYLKFGFPGNTPEETFDIMKCLDTGIPQLTIEDASAASLTSVRSPLSDLHELTQKMKGHAVYDKEDCESKDGKTIHVFRLKFNHYEAVGKGFRSQEAKGNAASLVLAQIQQDKIIAAGGLDETIDD